jgi:hypothetical protein
MKQVSTPAPDQGATTAPRAPITGVRRLEPGPRSRSRVRGSRNGSKTPLMRAHEVEVHRVHGVEEVRQLLGTDPVLPRDGSAGGDSPVAIDLVEQRMASILGFGLPHRQVDVAVADVTAAGDEGRRGGPPGRRPSGQVGRDGGAWKNGVDDVIRPGWPSTRRTPSPGPRSAPTRLRSGGRRHREHRASRGAYPTPRRPLPPGPGPSRPARRPDTPAPPL